MSPLDTIYALELGIRYTTRLSRVQPFAEVGSPAVSIFLTLFSCVDNVLTLNGLALPRAKLRRIFLHSGRKASEQPARAFAERNLMKTKLFLD